MIRRYEPEETQPTFEIIRKLAMTLDVSADMLFFADQERVPADELLLQSEAVSRLPDDKRTVVKETLDSLIIKYQTRDGFRTAH